MDKASKSADSGKNHLLCIGKYLCMADNFLTYFDPAKQVNLLLIFIQRSYLIQTSQTGCQPYTDTSLTKEVSIPLISRLALFGHSKPLFSYAILIHSPDGTIGRSIFKE